MGFWWCMLFFNSLVPVVMLIAGKWMQKRPPRKINGVYGFRTARSMQNEDTWQFANVHCGRLWWKMGWYVLIPSVLLQLPLMHSGDTAVSIAGIVLCTLQIIVMLASIAATESALKKAFNENGERK